MLRRERFRRYVTMEEVEAFVSGLASRAEMFGDPVSPARVTRDASADFLVALAREAQADVIVSGDADLLALERAKPPVVSPRTLVQHLSRER